MVASTHGSDVALTIERSEVHVWEIKLDCDPRTQTALRTMLSVDEQERSARFRFAELSRRWTVTRAAVRCVLAKYTGSEPQSLVFRAGAYAKPELAGSSQGISFNLSRTGRLALLAVADTRRTGIDAEIVSAKIDIDGITRHFFTRAEAGEILRLAPDARVTAFYACWTRKEAFLKALGAGLSLPLNSFQVTVRAEQPARLISVNGREPGNWSLIDLTRPGVAAALAVEGVDPILRRFTFRPLIPANKHYH